jgi:hypothetical protein
MEMNRSLLLSVIALLLMQSHALSQSQPQELPKFEVAGEFSTLERGNFGTHKTEPGFGGRFTYNLNEVFSLETAAYLLPKECDFCEHGGRVTELFGGVKIGKRFEKWGIFGKARPGLVSFSKGELDIVSVPAAPSFMVDFETHRTTHFATDLGGVVEFYVSKRIVTRFDAGDTIIHFGPQTTSVIGFNQQTNTLFLMPFTTPGKTTHNFQFMASVGFRF